MFVHLLIVTYNCFAVEEVPKDLASQEGLSTAFWMEGTYMNGNHESKAQMVTVTSTYSLENYHALV